MRLFIARNIGTNTDITVPIEPYVNMETGETETEVTKYDPKRPDCELVGECKTTMVNWHNAERWVVVTSDNVAPAGTYDVGDPSDPVFMASEPSTPERITLETELGLANGALSGWTWQMIFDDALSHTDAWRALFVNTGPDADIWPYRGVWLKGGSQ